MKLKELTDGSVKSLILNGKIDAEILSAFDEKMKGLMSAPMPERIVLTMTTTGGMIAMNYGLTERIRLLKRLTKVEFLGMGCVMSCGIDVMIQFRKEERFATRGTRFLIHSPQREQQLWLRNTTEASAIVLDEVRQEVRETQRWHRDLIRRLSKETGLNKEDLFKRSCKAWYFGAKTAKRIGLIHDILRED